jgi:hypothetical protein
MKTNRTEPHWTTSLLIRPLGIQPSRNIHTLQFLEEQLGRIRDMDLRDLILVVAILAFEGVLLQLRDRCHQSADVAHFIDYVSKGLVKNSRRGKEETYHGL